MNIVPAIARCFPHLSDAQGAVVSHADGPLLVIAGPGSGKTFGIVLRTLNLLLLGKAKPSELVLCTFTEKAAFELRDRLGAAARIVGFTGDLSELTVSTIHGLCSRILSQYRHRTQLGNGFETLDELTQLLFMFEHFSEIIGPPEDDTYFGRWSTRWTALEGVRGYFDKITEELIDSTKLCNSSEPFLRVLGLAYLRYEQALVASNRTDFAHLQRHVVQLLSDPSTHAALTSELKYVMVDEYQDTNYIQEQLLLSLSRKGQNLCVVGDEDRSLYRFRGATVLNILEFPSRVQGCSVLKLTTNYRSHRRIVCAPPEMITRI